MAAFFYFKINLDGIIKGITFTMLNQTNMKKGYIIAKANGWYWAAYDKVNDELTVPYTVYETRDLAELDLDKALNCRNANYQPLTITEIYYIK